MSLKTGFFFNPSSLRHVLEAGHPESPHRLEAINERIAASDAAARFESLTARLDAMAFIPELVLISAGFDGLANDPLGTFSLSEEIFHPATALLTDLADRACYGRIVSVLEGFNPSGTAAAVEAHLKALARVPLKTTAIPSGELTL